MENEEECNEEYDRFNFLSKKKVEELITMKIDKKDKEYKDMVKIYKQVAKDVRKIEEDATLPLAPLYLNPSDEEDKGLRECGNCKQELDIMPIVIDFSYGSFMDGVKMRFCSDECCFKWLMKNWIPKVKERIKYEEEEREVPVKDMGSDDDESKIC